MNDDNVTDQSGDIEDELTNLRRSITTREEFVYLLRRLLDDYDENGDEWDNQTLRDYLDGMRGFCMSLEGYYANRDLDVDCNKPSWQMFADLLLAARVYE